MRRRRSRGRTRRPHQTRCSEGPCSQPNSRRVPDRGLETLPAPRAFARARRSQQGRGAARFGRSARAGGHRSLCTACHETPAADARCAADRPRESVPGERARRRYHHPIVVSSSRSPSTDRTENPGTQIAGPRRMGGTGDAVR